MENKQIKIIFCPKCNWKEEVEMDEEINKCPKCDTWTFEVGEYWYYKNGKVIDKEFFISDRDEINFTFYDKKEAKRVINKAFKLMESKHHKRSKKNENR